MNESDVKNYYRHVERYDWVDDTRYPAKLFHQARAKHVAGLANQAINNGQLVVDVGCGTGLITRSLKGNVVGIDINPWALERARLHCPGKRFIEAESSHLPFNDNSIDVVVCSDVLEHLVDAKETVHEIHRILKPHCLFVGEVPSTSWLWSHRRLWGSTYKGREPFHFNYSQDQLRMLLDRFENVVIRRAAFGAELSFTARKGVICQPS